MKLVSKTLCLAVAGAALVLAGCSKTPARPNPSMTAMGPQTGGPSFNGGQPPMDIPTTVPGTILEQKGPGDIIDDGKTIRGLLQPVLFGYDSAAIGQAERVKLQAAKDYLDKNPGSRILLEGHCDWRGTAEYNLSLGDRRANAAKSLLKGLKVGNEKIEISTKGSLEASKNADDATMAKDRRVDLVIIKPVVPGAALPPL